MDNAQKYRAIRERLNTDNPVVIHACDCSIENASDSIGTDGISLFDEFNRPVGNKAYWAMVMGTLEMYADDSSMFDGCDYSTYQIRGFQRAFKNIVKELET